MATDPRVVRLTLEYDGAAFAGWQVQPGQRTVQGVLRDALQTLLREDITVHGSGRTDAGVHARAQVGSFRTTSDLDVERIRRGICGLVGDDLSCIAAEDAPADFHARFSATGKVYAYRLLLRNAPSPLLRGRAWHVPQPVDVPRMAEELASVVGRADWSAYRASDCGSAAPVKTLRRAEVVDEGGALFALVFESSGFLKQMVRVLAGTAVDVGRGRFDPGSMARIRDGLDRTAAGPTAPAHGLYLEEVLY